MTQTEVNVSDNQYTQISELAIFPLKLVHFPGGALPLKIFEQRYAEMTKVCLRDNVPFGVCLIEHGNEVGAPAEHALIGCSSRIADWDMPHPNLFHLACVGENVFRVLESHVEENGLIRGSVEWLTEDSERAEPDQFDACRNALKQYVERAGGAPDSTLDFDDQVWVSYRLAEVLPVELQTRQNLLEQRSTARRISRIAELINSA